MEISLKDLWVVLKKSLFFMIVGAVLCAALFWGYTSFRVQKVYQSSAKYILLAQSEATDDVAEMNNILVVGGKTIRPLANYLMNEKTMEAVLRFISERHAQIPGDTEYVLEYKYTAAQLLSMFNFIIPGENELTTVFEVKCKAYSSADSRILLDAFGNIINERSGKVLQDVFRVETSADPRAGSLVSPNLSMNTLIGAVLGAAVPFVLVLIYSILDTRIKTEDDVKGRFKYPILGQIPHV